jgi:seryl-tRNA synthetase
MASKFEKLIEHIVNADNDKASSLFHEIVVEKSRKIYESIIDEENDEFDFDYDETDDFIGDIEADEEGIALEAEEDDFEFDDDAEDDDTDTEFDYDDNDDLDDHEDDHVDLDDRVEDLESALDELKAEFDRLMSDEDDEEADEYEGDEGDEDETIVREFTEKVPTPSNNEEGSVNKTSTIAKASDVKDKGSDMVSKGGEEKGGKSVKPKGSFNGTTKPNVKPAPKPDLSNKDDNTKSPLAKRQ